jgi:UDP-glucose 4-epimerase
MGKRVFISGCSGYLAQTFIAASHNDPDIDWMGGIDVQDPRTREGFHFYKMDVRSAELPKLLEENRVDTLLHLAWVFNPTHNPELEYQVDVEGSRNVLRTAEKAEIPYMIYLSSTTSYGPHPDNPSVFDENYPRRGHAGYLYSKYKAEVDQRMMEFIASHPKIRTFLVRAPIVLGPHTRNVVTQMTGMPVMFAVRGFDPPMQFLHEEDLQRLLVWALKEEPTGIYNVSGHGTILFSEIVSLLKLPGVWLPSWILYPALEVLWKLRLVPFPSSILDFIRYPWVADSRKFLSEQNFEIRYSSREAFLAYAKARFPEKF